MAERKQEFWVVVFGIMLTIAVIVLMVDLSIKASILEQANKFRRDLEAAQNGQSVSRTVASGDNRDASHVGSDGDSPAIPFPSRVEKEYANNGTENQTSPRARTRGRRTIPPSTEDNA